jgi:hypothetical protein
MEMLVKDSAVDTRSEVCTLEEALSYKNDDIVSRFMESYDVPLAEAEELFEDTKKWLWLVAISKHIEGAPHMEITTAMLIVDKMWHTFILFTRDYCNYCEKYLGRYIHHLPTTKRMREETNEIYRKDPEQFNRNQQDRYRNMYSFIYDHLGEETLVKWYSHYRDQYTPDYIKSIWLRD